VIALGPTCAVAVAQTIARIIMSVIRTRAASELARILISVAQSNLGLPPIVIAIMAAGATATAAGALDFEPLIRARIVVARVEIKHDVHP
jgi:hypothetical protein